MLMKVSNELGQINTMINNLNEIKETLESEKPELILELFSDMKKKNTHLSHFISDNRDLLKGLTEHLNTLVEGTNIKFAMSPMHLNGSQLTISYKQRNIGEFNLSKKYMYLYSHIFHYGISNQLRIEQLEENITAKKESINRFELDMMRYRNMSPIKRKLKGIDKIKMAEMEDYLEKSKSDYFNSINELEIDNESLYDWWNQTLVKAQDLQLFVKKMEMNGFTHNFKGSLYVKNYFMFYRIETNHSHSSFLSYENGHISILSSDEWDTNEIDSSNLKRFFFTDEEFEFLCNQLENEPELSEVSRDCFNGVDCVVVFFDLGKLAISKNGLIVCHGEELNLFYLLRYPAIRKAFCLSYKVRTNEEHNISWRTANL